MRRVVAFAAVVAATVVVCGIAPRAAAQFVDGDLFVGGWPDHIYHVDPATWTVTTFADSSAGLDGVSSIAFTPTDLLICSNFNSDEILQFDSTGTGSLLYDASDGLDGPFGENALAHDPDGDLFVGCFSGKKIVRFPALGGTPGTFADSGDGVADPDGLAFTASGDLLVANRGTKQLLEIDSSGVATVFDTLPAEPYSIAIRSNGDVYVACHPPESIYRYAAGDPTQRTLFLSLPNNSGNPALRFTLDESVLYFTSFYTADLLTIDPDTAATTEVIQPGGLPGALSIKVFGTHECIGAFTKYGTGLAGAGGFVPSIDGSGAPIVGTTPTFEIADFVGGAAVFLLVGTAADDVPAFGGSLYVSFASQYLWIPVVVGGASGSPGDGDFSLPFDIPDDLSLACDHVYVQGLAADPQAVRKVSLSNGLDIRIGD